MSFVPSYNHSFEPGEDLSGAGVKYRAVKLQSDGSVILCTAITDVAIGILQNNPDSGGEAFVKLLGPTTKVVLGATLAAGAIVGTATSGKMQAAVTTQFPVGVLLAGGDDTEIVEMMLTASTVVA